MLSFPQVTKGLLGCLTGLPYGNPADSCFGGKLFAKYCFILCTLLYKWTEKTIGNGGFICANKNVMSLCSGYETFLWNLTSDDKCSTHIPALSHKCSNLFVKFKLNLLSWVFKFCRGHTNHFSIWDQLIALAVQ